MIPEEAYEVQYLYNSINEYLYFIIVYIEVYGPQHLNTLEKYVIFFKKEFQKFIQIFNGENQMKRINNLLCTATTAFYVKEETVYLSKNFESFKKVIYNDLIKSKVVDLVLRGISSIQDLCKNINLNYVINIGEDKLLKILRHCPHFFVDADSSVTVLQFHGLIGFDNCVYKTVTEYFQSYLQKVDALTYDEINLHGRFIPSCGIQNSLVIFCVIYISNIFKCNNNKVKIKNNWRVKSKNHQRIDIDQLSSRCQVDVSVSQLVFLAHGPFLQNCTGEIIHLDKSIGFIQCVVDFKGNYQGVFSVFFNITALKFVCDTENLENFLNIRDTVEFDAEFCDKTTIKDRYWKALKVTVTKQGLKRNKYKLKIGLEEYIESVGFKSKLNPSLELYLLNNQCMNSFTCDINADNYIKSSCCTRELPNNHLNFLNGNIRSDTEQTMHLLEEKQIEVFNDQEPTSFNLSEKEPTVERLKEPSQMSNSNHVSSIFNEKSQKKVIEAHKDKSQQSDKMQPMKSNIFARNTSSANVINFKQHIQEISKLMCQNVSLHKSSVLIPNFLFSQSTFIFGEIVIITNDEGVAISLNLDKQCEVFFQTEAIFNYSDTKSVLKEGNKVLLFIPHSDTNSVLHVATFVYILDDEESALISVNHKWVQDFVIDYFLPKLKILTCDINPCNCDLSKGLFLESPIGVVPTKDKMFMIKCYKFLMDLKEFFTFDKNTFKNFQTLVELLYLQNLGVNEIKMYKCITSLFKFLPDYRKFKISRKYRNNVRNLEGYRLPSHLVGKKVNQNEKKINSKSFALELQSNKCKKVKFDSGNYSSLTLTRLNEYKKSLDVKQGKCEFELGRASCSSLSSYVSCNSKDSSDEMFHSCESLSGKLTSDTEADSKSDHSQISIQNDCTHHETPCDTSMDRNLHEKTSHSETAEKCLKIQVTDMEIKELSPKKSETNRICDQGKKYLKYNRIPSFKWSNRKKRKTVLESEDNICKCQKQLVETTACVSAITNSCLLLSLKNDSQNIIVSFPKCFIPKDICVGMKLKSTLKVAIVPHKLIQLSRLLYIEFFS